MKIGFVLDDSLDKPDGVQNYVLSLGSWLSQHGHKVHYLVGETHRTDVPNVDSLSRNVKVRFNGNSMSVPLPAKKQLINSLLSKEKFDILHVQMPYNPFLARRIIDSCDKSITTIVGTFHILPYGQLHRVATKLLAVWLRNSLQHFSSVVAVSEPARQFSNKYFTQVGAVLPCAVNIPVYRQAMNNEPKGWVQIMFIGRLVKRKGCLQLLKTLSYLVSRESTKNIKVTIAGRGPQLGKLQRYVRRHHLDSIVTFAGYVSEEKKYDLLANADIAVFPSTSGESFGIVLLEAMAVSKGVVIAGNNPGYSSVMDGHNKQLVNPHNTKDMADKLLYFIKHGEARHSAHVWQRQHVGNFDIGVVGPKLIAWYNEALNARQDMR